MNKYSNRALISTLFMCICLIVVLLFSEAYILNHVHHDCTGEDCPICQQIRAAVNNIRQLTTGMGSMLLLSFTVTVIIYVITAIPAFIKPNTLVKWKVRLND